MDNPNATTLFSSLLRLHLHSTEQSPYLLTYLLNPRSRVLHENLRVFQLVKQFPPFYGTRRFIAAFTSTRHQSLSWASSIRSIPPHPIFCRSILILSSHLRLCLPSCLFSSGFSTSTLHTLLPHTRYMPRPSHSSWFYHPWGVEIILTRHVNSFNTRHRGLHLGTRDLA